VIASSTVTWAAVSGVVFFALGVGLSELIRGGTQAGISAEKKRREHGEEMRKVVLAVEPKWNGTSYEDGVYDLAVLQATVRVSNHGTALVKNVRVRMHKRPTGVETARMLPALPPGETQTVIIERALGLIEEQPFEEEDDWLSLYWFDAEFEDTRGRTWLVTYNPRDETQTVDRVSRP
jgi:hypothetical protein